MIKEKIWIAIYTSEDNRCNYILFTSFYKEIAIREIEKHIREYINEYYEGEDNEEQIKPVNIEDNYIKYEWHDAEWELCLEEII